jgi:hypothetical protein
VAGEQAGGVMDRFGSRKEGWGSLEGFSVAGGGGSAAGKRQWQAGVGVTSGVRAVEEEVLDGAVLRVRSRRSVEGWSRLSVVARIDQRGTVVVVRTWGRRRRLACRCRARGGDGEFKGEPG